MKQLTYLFLTMLLLGIFSCHHDRAARQYERFLEDTARMEFITPPEDTVKIEEIEEALDWEDEGEIITIPDIPQERSVNMGASDYELRKMMSGRID